MEEIEFRRVTSRLVAFRVTGAPRWDGFFMCDDCLEALQKMPTRRPAEG
jgi:hypothetical protein